MDTPDDYAAYTRDCELHSNSDFGRKIDQFGTDIIPTTCQNHLDVNANPFLAGMGNPARLSRAVTIPEHWKTYADNERLLIGSPARPYRVPVATPDRFATSYPVVPA